MTTTPRAQRTHSLVAREYADTHLPLVRCVFCIVLTARSRPCDHVHRAGDWSVRLPPTARLRPLQLGSSHPTCSRRKQRGHPGHCPPQGVPSPRCSTHQVCEFLGGNSCVRNCQRRVPTRARPADATLWWDPWLGIPAAAQREQAAHSSQGAAQAACCLRGRVPWG